MKLLFFFLFASSMAAQFNGLDSAYINAKKGIYFAVSNIPEKKEKLEKELIRGDSLIASVKLFKEVEGIRIESEGYFGSYKTRAVLYSSYKNLIKDGFMKSPSIIQNENDTESIKE